MKYWNEDVLISQFEDIVRGIEISDEVFDSILVTIKELNKYEIVEKEERLVQLNKKVASIRNEIQQIYSDKINGVIDIDFWQEQHNVRKEMLTEVMINIEALDSTSSKYMDEIVAILELSKSAHSKFIQLSDEGKLLFVKSLLSNCYMKDGKLSWEYNTAFSIIAENIKNNKKLPRLDSNQ